MKKAEIVGIQWSCLSAEQLRALSVVTITKPSAKDGGGDEDRSETPYDPRLGEQRNYTPCGTCGKYNTECPGHFGIIELPKPVYNKNMLPITLKVLQSVCKHCARPRMRPEFIKMQRFTTRLHGWDRLKAIATKCAPLKKCPWDNDKDGCTCVHDDEPNDFENPDGVLPKTDVAHPCSTCGQCKCSEAMVSFSLANPKKGELAPIYYSATYEGVTKREEFSAEAALDVLSRISNEHLELLGFNENLLNHPEFTSSKYMLHEDQKHVHQFRPESLIIQTLMVLPPGARPWVVSEQEENERKDDDLTDKYNAILKSVALWHTFAPSSEGGSRPTTSGGRGGGAVGRALFTRRGNLKTRNDVERDIASHVWTLMNNKDEKSKLSSGGRAHRSIVCRLKGKFGRIQCNVGGKRVDFCARTVIVGAGVRLEDDQLGIPRDIAEKLTKPEWVIAQNIEDIRDLVARGKVNCVIRAGKKTNLSKFPDKGIHYPIQIGDVCERQLEDGDIVLFNRQPTLRIESMMAFRTKIVEGDAFQMPLWATKSFNAD